MPSGELYTTVGALYDYVLSFYQKTGKDIPVPEALKQMRENGLLRPDRPEIPPYHSDISVEEFRDSIRRMPVYTDAIIASFPEVFPDDEGDIFPEGKDVFAFMHMPFTGRHLHYHDFFEITYVVSGSCPYIFEGERTTLREGDVAIVSDHAWHEVAPYVDCFAVAVIVRKSTFNAIFGGLLSKQDLVSLFFRKCLQEKIKGHPNYVLLHTANDMGLRRAARELVYESNLCDDYSNESAISLLNLFISRALRSSAADVVMHNYEGFSRQDFGFSTILQYIQQNYRTVSLSSLADTFHFSEAHLSKLIQHNMNESFTEVLRQLRMNHAVELLIHTTMKISEIADAVGYVSIDHFTRTFRRTFGLTPRAYRAMHRPDAVPDHP